MYKNSRMVTLIKLLSANEETVSSSVICAKLKIKPRTLRNELSKYKNIFWENGIEIISKHGAGYSIQIHNENKYYEFIRQLMEEESASQCLIPQAPEERINYLIRLLLTASSPLKLDDIAERIYISRSTLSNDLKEVRNRLSYFHLAIESKSNNGIQIAGDELHLRSCIHKYFYCTESVDQQFLQQDLKNKDQQMIQNILYSELTASKLKLTDMGFQNLVVHIYIAILRNKEHIEIEATIPDNFHQLREEKEFCVAQKLIKQLEEVFFITFPQIEIYYFTIHLRGKKTFDYNHKNNYVITDEIQLLFDKIYKRIRSEYNIDFSDDFELYTLLALHFQPMFERLKYKLAIENPVLNQIKKDNILVFDMAVTAGMMIEELTGLSVNENEVGYMALHFALAYERKLQQIVKKNIIIVCASGAGSSQILLYKVKKKYGAQLDKIFISSLYDLEVINQEEYDFILSTIPIPFNTKIPVIRVEYFLTNDDFNQINEALSRVNNEADFVDQYFKQEYIYTNIKPQSKKQVIKQLCERMKKHTILPEHFLELIMQREAVSPTEYGNLVAFPHPIKPVGNETIVAAAILEKPIKWEKQWVKYIFLLSINLEEEHSLAHLYEVLIDLFYNEKSLKEFEEQPTVDTLKKLFCNSYSQEPTTSQSIFS